MTARMHLVRSSLHDSCCDQRCESLGEHLRRDAEIPMELIEARQAQIQIAQDERGPPFPNRVERARKRAMHSAKRGSLHAVTLPE
jgi:hypothetical protein